MIDSSMTRAASSGTFAHYPQNQMLPTPFAYSTAATGSVLMVMMQNSSLGLSTKQRRFCEILAVAIMLFLV
jgi:hypothetical protein